MSLIARIPRTVHLAGITAFCTALLMLQACNESSQQQTTVRQSGQVDSSAAPAATPEPVAVDPSITLPVLDALFYEEGFEAELKSKLQLSAQQTERLRLVSREAVAELAEDGVGDYSGSSRSAATRAQDQIRSIVGEEKAGQLFRLVHDRYSSGEVEGLMSAQLNAVPKDTRIVVNAPAYRMDVFRDGQLLKSYKVGIGYPEFPLPTGMRRAETIIFNPSWTPPDEPWVKGKFKPGEKVEAGSKDNPLGPIKIPIGAPSLIHGGKSPAKLGTFASHGCVGLTNAGVQNFAQILADLGGASVSQEEIEGYRRRKTETKHMRLEKPVPVELRYETIVAENGALKIFRDVYERGTNTVASADRVLQVYNLSFAALQPAEKSALYAALTEMNRDAQGKPIVENVGANPDSSAVATNGDSGREDGVAASKIARAKKGKETKTIVGRKEILVPIAALAGKGYPPAQNMIGETPPTAAKKTR